MLFHFSPLILENIGEKLVHIYKHLQFRIHPLIRLFCAWFVVLSTAIIFFAHNYAYIPDDIEPIILPLFPAIAGAYLFFRHLKTRRLILALCLSAQFIFVYDVIRNGYGPDYDQLGHRMNIEYYVKHHAMPPSDLKGPLTGYIRGGGHEYHQPPIFYTLAALTFGFTNLFTSKEYSYRAINNMNFFFFDLFLLYGALSIIFVIKSPLLSTIAVCAFLFSPGNIIHHFRLTNDILVYLSFTGAAYHFMYWVRFLDTKQLRYALLWLAVVLGTKSSSILLAISLVSIILVFLAPRYKVAAIYRSSQQLSLAHLRPYIWVILAILIGFSLGYGRNIYNFIQWDGNSNLLFGKPSEGGRGAIFVPSQFFSFNWDKFIESPYTNFWQNFNTDGTRNFWIFTLKTWSFEEWSWKGTVQATFINLSLLGMWCYFLSLVFHRAIIQQRSLGWAGYYGIIIFWCLLGLAAVKISHPENPWAQIRHIYMIVPFFVVSYSYILSIYRRINFRVYGLGLMLMLIYLVSSLVHIGCNVFNTGCYY